MDSQRAGDITYSRQDLGDSPEIAKELSFTDEFSRFSEAHLGFITEAKKAIDSFHYLSDQGEVVVTDNLTVECLGRHPDFSDSISPHERKYFRIKIKDGSGDFFVRVNHDVFSSDEQGADELVRLSKLKKKLESFKEFKVRVVDYALGYKDKKASYFVSKFEPLLQTTCYDLFLKLKNGLAKPDEAKKIKIIKDKVNRLKELEVLEGWGLDDFGENNMAYDEENDELVLFDIRVRRVS